MNFGFNPENNMQPKMVSPESSGDRFDGSELQMNLSPLENGENVEQFDLGNMRPGKEVVVTTVSGSKYRIQHPGGSAQELIVYYRPKGTEVGWKMEGILRTDENMLTALIEKNKPLVLPVSMGGPGSGQGKIITSSLIQTIKPRG